MIELKGFYSLEKPGDFHNLVDVQVRAFHSLATKMKDYKTIFHQYMSAMIHPGGGRNDVPQRFKRHFITFNCTIPTDDAIDHIFGTIAQVNNNNPRKSHFDATSRVTSTPTAGSRTTWRTWCSCWSR